jgi:hypothetical protein
MVWVRTASRGESLRTLSFFSVSGMPSLRVAGACLVPACDDAAVGIVTESVNVHAALGVGMPIRTSFFSRSFSQILSLSSSMMWQGGLLKDDSDSSSFCQMLSSAPTSDVGNHLSEPL